jgi:hypothetical protein
MTTLIELTPAAELFDGEPHDARAMEASAAAATTAPNRSDFFINFLNPIEPACRNVVRRMLDSFAEWELRQDP